MASRRADTQALKGYFSIQTQTLPAAMTLRGQCSKRAMQQETSRATLQEQRCGSLRVLARHAARPFCERSSLYQRAFSLYDGLGPREGHAQVVVEAQAQAVPR
jgi:hypothetical protein